MQWLYVSAGALYLGLVAALVYSVNRLMRAAPRAPSDPHRDPSSHPDDPEQSQHALLLELQAELRAVERRQSDLEAHVERRYKRLTGQYYRDQQLLEESDGEPPRSEGDQLRLAVSQSSLQAEGRSTPSSDSSTSERRRGRVVKRRR